MFGKKKVTTFVQDQVETLVGKETEIIGTIRAKGSVRIDGKLEGDLVTAGDIVVGEGGTIQAKEIKGRNALISGTVYGAVEVQDKLELFPTAKLYGDILVGALIIGEGATFKGACAMRGGETPQTGK